MDERPGEGLEPPGPSGGGEMGGPGPDASGGLPVDPEPVADQGDSADDGAGGAEGALTPEQRALAEEAAEIRRLVDEGAGTPEAIRELAARLREHRAREEELWRTAVKPALVKEGKGRLRGHSKPVPIEPRSVPAAKSSQSLWLGLGVLGVVLVVIVAANTSVWVLVLPVIALLVWAWYQGRDDTSGR